MSKAAVRTALGAGALAGGLTTALAARTPRRPHEEEAIRRYDEARKAGTLTPRQEQQKTEADEAYRRRGGGLALAKGAGIGLSTASVVDALTGKNLRKYIANKSPNKFLPRAFVAGMGAVGAASVYNMARRLAIKPDEKEKEAIKRARIGLLAHPDAILRNDTTSIKGRVAWNLLDDEAKARESLAERQKLISPWAAGAGVAGTLAAVPLVKDGIVSVGKTLSKSKRIQSIRGL